MEIPDIINGMFESLGGFMILKHCWTLWNDKMVRGVNLFATAFFTSWGFWNLFYYPHLGQWWSFAGGLLIVSANTLWVSMMVYYKKNEGGRK